MDHVEGGSLQQSVKMTCLRASGWGAAMPGQEKRVKICGDDPAGAAYLVGQPQRDTSRPESDLGALPALPRLRPGWPGALHQERK